MAAIPFFCWLDYKYRDIPYKYLALLAGINLPVLIYQYYIGAYTWEAFIVSILPCAMYYVLMRRQFFYGDDMLFLWIISAFCIVNPIKPQAGGMPITLMLYMIGVLVLSVGVNFWLNIFKKKNTIKKSEELPEVINSMIGMMTDYGERGIPMIIPISVAFILAVIL